MTSLDDPEAMAEEAHQIVTDGFSAIKLKISGQLNLDLQRITNVRKAVGDDIFIKVDANESYDPKSAIQLSKKMAALGVEVFEQPVPRHQTAALLEVKKHSPIRIEADQSVGSVADAYRLIQHRVVDSINTSVLKAGGLIEARRIAEMCRLGGVECTLANTAGSMVGDAAGLQLAASCPGVSSLCELGEFTTVSGDPFTGLEIKHGMVKVPDGEGLGVQYIGSF
jgi:L-alanine-DL-glutamate epimerase-like enolase superfamily enzyme